MRHPDWQLRTIQTIQAASERPFCWGKNDCCLFVADVCLAACDKDPAAAYRGRYRTEIGAKRVLAKTHGSIAAALLGVALIFVVWALAMKKENARSYLLAWIVCVIFTVLFIL